MSVDFGDVFTIAVRHVVPLARRRRLSFAFDCQCKGLRFTADPVTLQGGLHRLFLELVGLMRGGSLLISAKAADSEGLPRIRIHVAGVGPIGSPDEIAATCKRMLLEPDLPGPRPSGAMVARGLCPHTSGAIELSAILGEGVLITLEISSLEPAPEDECQQHDALGARAWLVNVDDALATSWTARLQRLGWAISRFPSYHAAMDQLRDAPQSARPALVLVLETGDPAKDGTLDLPGLLPGWSRLVYAVQTGSITLRHPQAVSGYEVHVYPLTPHELQAITDGAAEHDDEGSGTTVPMPLAASDMPVVLIVDDTALNLVVGQCFAEALGYSVRTAHDGLEAIEACRQQPPHVVLMNLDMPRLNGIDTVRSLRAMQSEGSIPPFPITIVTAGWTPQVRKNCLDAGADACLEKPMSLEAMAQELSRLSSYR